MALREALAADKPHLAASVRPVQAAGPGRLGGSDVGTAQGTGDRAGGGALKRGDRIKYRALHGDDYDAEVLSQRADGQVDIEVLISPISRMYLSRIVLAPSAAKADRGEAYRPG